MIRKNALLLASGLTAFVLVLVGGVATRLSTVASAEGAPQEPTSSELDAQVLSTLVQQREETYRQIIDQANRLLAETPAAVSDPAFPINADTAVAIVLTTVRGGSLEKAPELVDYMGAAAWEVALVQGLVYVDANTGKILANGAIPVIVVVDDGGSDDGNGGASSSDDDHDDDEDEHHEDEDHEGED
jgi:hypothetical protein